MHQTPREREESRKQLHPLSQIEERAKRDRKDG